MKRRTRASPKSFPLAKPFPGPTCGNIWSIRRRANRCRNQWRGSSEIDMARVEFAPEIIEDLDRILVHSHSHSHSHSAKFLRTRQGITIAVNPDLVPHARIAQLGHTDAHMYGVRERDRTENRSNRCRPRSRRSRPDQYPARRARSGTGLPPYRTTRSTAHCSRVQVDISLCVHASSTVVLHLSM